MIAAIGGSAYTIATAPFLPWWALAALAGAAVLVLALGLWRRARGVAWRGAAVAMLLAILVNPSLVEEKRVPLRDVAVVVVDESPSQDIGNRRCHRQSGQTDITAANVTPYRDAAWLIKRQAVSVMPSVASLKALRLLGRKERGSKPIVGFGNPVFNAAALRHARNVELANRACKLGH